MVVCYVIILKLNHIISCYRHCFAMTLVLQAKFRDDRGPLARGVHFSHLILDVDSSSNLLIWLGRVHQRSCFHSHLLSHASSSHPDHLQDDPEAFRRTLMEDP